MLEGFSCTILKYMNNEQRKEVRRVERLLGDIRENTKVHWIKSLMSGMLYGVGVVVGTVVAVALLGWVLSLFDVIPGLGEITYKIQTALQRVY